MPKLFIVAMLENIVLGHVFIQHKRMELLRANCREMPSPSDCIMAGLCLELASKWGF